MEDGMWYRGKIKSHSANNTEVFFCDYGNSSTTNELRIIPVEIANAPTLAKYCSLRKPKDIQFWSNAAEQRFLDCTDGGTVFTVDVISPGKKSIVDLIVNEKSIVDEIADLCVKYSLSALENTLRSNSVVESETVKAFIIDGTPDRFYIQLESSTNELNRLNDLMESAVEWPKLNEKNVGHLCAALFDGSYNRAKILSLNNEGATVHFIDYGNESVTTDLRKLPENLENIQQLSILCSLESINQTFSPELIERFKNLPKDDTFDVKFISKTSSSAVIQLFEHGVLFEDKPKEALQSIVIGENRCLEILDSTETNEIGKLKAFISERVSPSHFYIQLNNDMEQAMESASNFPSLGDSDKYARKICAAFWEGYFYRAEIISVDDQGAKVHFIDYGNESYSNDLRKLPDDIERIERSSILCTLENEGRVFSNEFIEKFMDLDLNEEFEFEFLNRTAKLKVVRMYVDGELFSDVNTMVNNMQKNVALNNCQIETESETIALTIETTKQPMISMMDTNEIGKLKAFISERVSPSHFYIQLHNEMEQAMEDASNFILLDDSDKFAGKICAAFWEGSFYRAEILSVDDQGTKVHFIDYGNESYSNDLRKLPNDIERIERSSILCTLENENRVLSNEFIDKFMNLDLNEEFEFEFIRRSAKLNVVRLYLDGELFSDVKAMMNNTEKNDASNNCQIETESETNELTLETTEQQMDTSNTNKIGKLKAFISERVSPSHFYIQVNNDMEQAMEGASNFLLLGDSDKCAGKICAAFWEGYFYRAEILSVDDQGTKVHFIDYGNESYSDDLRELPDDIKRIERSSILCTLENKNQVFSDEFIDKFRNLDLNEEFEFEIIKRSTKLNVLRLYIDGELFSDNSQTETESENKSIVNEIISVTIGKAEQQQFVNEIVGEVIDHSVNGIANASTLNVSVCSSIIDPATEAEKIKEQHFKSVEQMGLASGM